ncbi:diguanylate cyclase [Psychromonas sp. GE-S-Ul-11]|uniref:sensor domain-containing diguanylate cyclase n=1 Tax=Psychromonas sp. GE-S-Ul-11 TaxID=3241170 RepID=UPI00390CA621
MFHSIKAQIITIYSIVIVAFASLLLLTVYINEKDRMLELELTTSTEISQMHATKLSQEFAQYVAMLKVLSGDFEPVHNDQETIHRLLQRLIKAGGDNFINAIYIDQALNLTDANYNRMKAVHPSLLKGKDWENKEFNVSNPVNTSFETKPVIMVSVPIRNEKNEWSGTIAAAVPIDILPKKLASIKLGLGSYAWLVDTEGLLVSHPNPEFIMKNRATTEENPNYPGFNEIVKEAKLKNNGYGRYMDLVLDESKIVTYAHIKYLPNWVLYVTTKESEIFQGIYEILYNVIIIAVLLMVVFLVFISQLANKVTKPIVKLTREVKCVVNSNSEYFHGIDSKDEIGQLSKAFDSSFRKIRTHTMHLEKMVNQRTQEIATKNSLLSEQNDQLEELVSKDPLTHLYNRRAFSRLLDKELARARRHKSPVTLAILDIDHFKRINDTYGHNVGDEVLCRFANELTINMRVEDLICRWGGEEFVILLWGATARGAFKHMDEMRENIANMKFDTVDKVTFSIGMATIRHDEEFKDWLHRADDALYKAKEMGRNRTVIDDSQIKDS